MIDCLNYKRTVAFFSLDICGGDLDALNGFGAPDLDYILVETDITDVVQKLLPEHEFIDKLTFHDYLFKIVGFRFATYLSF